MEQPPNFVQQTYSSYVSKLNKVNYVFKQVLRIWFDKFSSFLLAYGFIYSTDDSSQFICHLYRGSLILVLCVYNMLLIGSSSDYLY